MNNVKQIVVADIEWDADTQSRKRLPKSVTIDIDETNVELLEDIDGCADNLLNYLSDEYGYCINGFTVQCE